MKSKLFLFLSIIFLTTELLAEEQAPSALAPAVQSLSAHGFVTAKLSFEKAPVSVTGYVSFFTNAGYHQLSGVYLEEAGDDASGGIAWGSFLPPETSEPVALMLLVEHEERAREYFEFSKGEFTYVPPESADDIRNRIIFSREQGADALKERERKEAELARLQQDARVIGGFEKVEILESELRLEQEELKRIRSQVAQLKRSVAALKSWKIPSDLSERKRVFTKDIGELQTKRRDKQKEGRG